MKMNQQRVCRGGLPRANCFQSSSCDTRGLIDPVYEYNHRLGRSITDGYVYRGNRLPDLIGRPDDPNRGNIDLRFAWLRAHRRDEEQVPPLGSHIVDHAGTSVLAQWIDGLRGCP